MLDTVASNKTAQVTLGVLQKPQSTIVNYYCIVNCYYFVSLVVPSVMTCIATLSAVMRWVFVHYLSGEQVLRLITELTEWQGHWDKRCRACQKMDSSQTCCKKYCKRFATGSVTLVGKDELSINCFFFFLFFHSYWSLLKHTHADTHTHIWETVLFLSSCAPKAAFQLTQCISVSSLKSFYMVLAYTCSVGLWMDISGLSTMCCPNHASLCGVWSVNTHSSVTGSYLIVSPVSPNPHRELFAFFSVILKDIYWTV